MGELYQLLQILCESTFTSRSVSYILGEHIKLKRRDFGKLISPNVMMMRSKWRSQEDVGDGGGMKRD